MLPPPLHAPITLSLLMKLPKPFLCCRRLFYHHNLCQRCQRNRGSGAATTNKTMMVRTKQTAAGGNTQLCRCSPILLLYILFFGHSAWSSIQHTERHNMIRICSKSTSSGDIYLCKGEACFHFHVFMTKKFPNCQVPPRILKYLPQSNSKLWLRLSYRANEY